MFVNTCMLIIVIGMAGQGEPYVVWIMVVCILFGLHTEIPTQLGSMEFLITILTVLSILKTSIVIMIVSGNIICSAMPMDRQQQKLTYVTIIVYV